MCSELTRLYPAVFRVVDDNRLTSDLKAARDVFDTKGERALVSPGGLKRFSRTFGESVKKAVRVVSCNT